LPTPEDKDKYLEIIAKRLSHEELDRLLRILNRWATVEDLEKLTRQIGGPKELGDLIEELQDRKIKVWDWWEDFWDKTGRAIRWLILMGGVFGIGVAAKSLGLF
jgi:hypothetical protein